MVAVFEPNDNPDPQPRTATATPQDLATLAQRRQQQKVQTTALAPGDSLFPIASAPGTLPNLLGGDGRPESGGILTGPNVGVAPGQDNRQTQSSNRASNPASPPQRSDNLEAEPTGVAYVDLTPAQKEQAFRSLEVEVGPHAVDEAGETMRTPSGASVVQVNPRIPRVQADPVFLAEDGVAAQSALFKAIEQRGINARPVDSYDGYTVGFEVDDRSLVQFMGAVRFLEPSNVDVKEGRIYVRFDERNVVNRHFAKQPFGSK